MEAKTSDLSAWLNTLPIPKRLAKLAAVIVPLTLFSICFLLLTLPPQGSLPHSQAHSSHPAARREAYVTFLSSTKKRGYADSVRLLLFALKHDPELRDPLDRDFIVVTTRYTSAEVKSQLAREGAIIRDTPLITGMPQLEHYKTADDHNYRDVFTKLAIWNMTEYDRMFYLDSDMLVLKEIWSLWDMPGSDPPSGLAAFSDVLGEHKVPPADRDYFNAGALILRPDSERYGELLNVRGYDVNLGEQVSTHIGLCLLLSRCCSWRMRLILW